MRRLDILGVPFDELPAALIYFTGNSYFNRSMRLKARHLGYRLNQRGLYKDVSRARDGTKLTEGQKIDCKTEEEILRILGVPWRWVQYCGCPFQDEADSRTFADRQNNACLELPCRAHLLVI